MPFSHSLRSRFALIIALLVAALTWLLGTLIGEYSSEQIRKEVGRDMAEQTYTMVDRLDRDMAGRAAMLRVLASLQTLREPQDPKQVRHLLDNLQREVPSFAWIGLTDAQGTVVASSNGVLEGASIAQRPVYMEAQKGLFIGDVHEAVLLAKLLPNPTGEAMKFVDISLPMSADRGKPVAVLASHLSWRWADEVRQAILAPIQKRRNVEFFIIGKDRSILLGPREMIGQSLQLPALEGLRPGASHWAVQRWPDGTEYLTGMTLSQGYQDYPGLGWTVVARQDLELAYAPARSLMLTILMWGGGLAVVFALAGWMLSGHYTRPLHDIVEAADRLSAGQISEIPELHGSREIAQLSQSIRKLVERLTLQKRALVAMENLAHQDPLTGLPNRLALEKCLLQAQQLSTQQGSCLALLYLDLDDFTAINEVHDTTLGDHLLREVAQRLRRGLRDGDMVARLGGDEFLMVLQVPEREARTQAQHIAERTLITVRQPVSLETALVSISCSIGGAVWPLDHEDLGSALDLADQALHRAKQDGRNHVRFQDESTEAS
ncbi:diguanylate cyclase [Pseudomonas mendocina]|uniref:diguanylate cyclase domain-containing protein n=1 Tax=Pseudomonas sp. UBA6323 TaxID=1947329 RepID=UPI0018D71E0A|nr:MULTISPECIES: diguanylate cyclase [Pseudomonas]MBH3338973.1 diguanylate cyclase [Pseudomonas mendocina]